LDSALQKINEIITIQPDFADAHLLKGQLTSATNDTQGAVESFEKYKALLPETLQSRLFLANAYVKNKQFAEAEIQLDLLLKIIPEQAFVNQLKGLVRYHANDLIQAKLFTEKAMQYGLSTLPNRVIAGISAFKLGNFEQAYTHINIIKDDLPANSPLQKLLVLLQLKVGDNNAASEALNELDGLTEDDVVLLSLASAQFMRDGDVNGAKALAAKANKLDYTKPLNLAQKGMLLLTLQDLKGITDLENALQISPDLNVGNTALARAYIANGLFDKALALSEVWISQTPDKVNGYNLAALAQLGMENTDKAETIYRQILTLDQADPNANLYFADINIQKSNKQQATEYLLAILKVYPDNIAALTKYFIVSKELGDSKKGLDIIEQSYKNNATNPNVQLLYAKALFTDSRYTMLIDTFNKIELNEKTHNALWQLLSNVHLKLNNPNQAANILEKWVSVQEDNKEAYLSSIVLKDITGATEDALDLIRQGSVRFPDEQQFTILQVHFYLKSQRGVDAKTTFDLLPAEIKASPVGIGFQGQILLLQGKYKDAIPMLKSYYQANPNNKSATLYAKALKNDNRVEDAITFLKSRAEQNAGSVLTQLQIAELSINNKNFAEAELSYRKILQFDPENTRALHNLANLLLLKSEYNEALPLAQKALQLMPQNPMVLNILSQILMKKGDNTQALDYAEQAHSLDSSSQKLLFNLAELLVITGNKPRALEKLSLIPDNSTEYKDQVAALLKQL
jgi:putative PEP-CTERM system TPR-repeat lipoprotein